MKESIIDKQIQNGFCTEGEIFLKTCKNNKNKSLVEVMEQ